MRIHLLSCVVLISISATVQANSGTMRFSGSVTDPSCTTQLSLPSQELQLSRCPDSAHGARISLHAVTNDSVAMVPGKGYLDSRITLSADEQGAGHASAPGRYPLHGVQRTRLQGDYVLVIDYP